TPAGRAPTRAAAPAARTAPSGSGGAAGGGPDATARAAGERISRPAGPTSGPPPPPPRPGAPAGAPRPRGPGGGRPPHPRAARGGEEGATGGGGVGDRGVGLYPLDAVAREVDRTEERRGDAQRVGRRAHVVHEPGQGQLRGPRPAADGRGRLVDAHRPPAPGE